MEHTLEQLQVAYGMVLSHLKQSTKKDNDRDVRFAIQVLIELEKRIKKLSKNDSNETI
jgi:hypothetical protein